MTPAFGSAVFVGGQSREGAVVTMLHDLGFRTHQVDGADAMNALLDPVSVCVVDLQENGEALRVARAVRTRHPRAVVIGIADPARPTASADAILAGVFDVLPRQSTAQDLEAVISNGRAQAALGDAPSPGPSEPPPFGLVGASPAMKAVLDLVQRAAGARCGILVCGERGTGRETVARAIHALGPRLDRQFAKVHCAGPGPEEIELALFGITGRASAHTSARPIEHLTHGSRVAEASGGVLFLEDVADLPLRAQTRLARVLRDREVMVGEARARMTLDIRLMAATDRPLEPALAAGTFRRDLYEQLAVMRIDLPALRHRREDIPVLATHFLKEACRANEIPLKSLSSAALSLLAALPWRGNAPELRGLLERLTLLVPRGLIRLEDVLAHTQFDATISPNGYEATLRQARSRFEHDYISAVLRHQHGRIPEAARVLGMQRTNLYRKMRKLKVSIPTDGNRGS